MVAMIDAMLAGASLYDAAESVAYQRRNARALCKAAAFRAEYEHRRCLHGQRAKSLDEHCIDALAIDHAERIPAALKRHVAARLNSVTPALRYVIRLPAGG
jgi:hypothetical protein